MRKIERLMNAAISESKDWKNANTEVVNIDDVSKVYLHGNLIAEVDDNGIKLYDGGWQSNTTKSRLNAILTEHGIAGEGVFQKNYQWFIRLYNGTEFFVTEFRSGMRLGALAAKDLLVWAILTNHTSIPLINMNDFELFELKENYINHIIDGMDMDCLVQMAHDLLMDAYEKCTEDEMIEEIKDLYDEDTLIDLLPDAK